MDPEPTAAADGLSRLGDAALGHILSFLPAPEAARAAALSRRWRHVFPAVHTLSFVDSTRRRRRRRRRSDDYYDVDDDEDEGDEIDDYQDRDVDDDDDEGDEIDDYHHDRDSEDSGSPGSDSYRDPALARAPAPAPAFADSVSAALHGRHRVSRVSAAPLRGLSVEFGGSDAASAAVMDGWICYALHQAGDELHIDLRLNRKPICSREYALRCRRAPEACESAYAPPSGLFGCSTPPRRAPEASRSAYSPPTSLFRCVALRSLRLGSCRLDHTPTAAVALPSLETLHLTRVADRTGAVQRLVSACPRLADLTLEACCNLTELSVAGARLRRLALRCCHRLAVVVAADLSELRAFEFSGAMPGPSIQTAHVPRQITSCTLNFCGEEAADAAEMASLRDFLQIFASTTNLQLKSARLGSGVGHDVFTSGAVELPSLQALRHLELTGALLEDDAATVAGVGRMLERTPCLETLSLFFMPNPEEPDYYFYNNDDDELRAVHKLRYNRYVQLAVPEGAGIACLRERTREINLVHYHGGTAQRMLAKFLLCNAWVVNEVYCEFAQGPLFIQTKLMEEITGWVLNKSANMVFF
jgi:hypothetical protein